jgi:N6-adenosine-specific RNA methylase IME4
LAGMAAHRRVVGVTEFPRKKYKTILADPPWRYNRDWWPGSKKSAFAPEYNERTIPMPYPEMTLDEIKALPVASIADVDCELYLWVTQKYLPFVFDVIKAWGFRYCQTLTWCKKPMGTGQGGVYTPTTEFLILARKGKMPKVKRIDTTWFPFPRTGKHSKKPEMFHAVIEGVTYQPRIELFARECIRPGWDYWGNEVPS